MTGDLPKILMRFYLKNGLIGQVTMGSKKHHVCIPRNSVIIVPRHTSKIPSKVACLVDQAEHHNLPLHIVINMCMVTTKARAVPVLLMNTTKQNIWIWQTILSPELFDAEFHQVEHRANMGRKGMTSIYHYSLYHPMSSEFIWNNWKHHLLVYFLPSLMKNQDLA